ncbi:hypothetical protein VNO78_18210 [Psophocarpus tetragonolobus]|uniref:Uncharacterized protein n=1 Tax=Psophocarpus tetragonolobus TaxID=3891 RepID=A0AAN9SP20_PSOTE
MSEKKSPQSLISSLSSPVVPLLVKHTLHFTPLLNFPHKGVPVNDSIRARFSPCSSVTIHEEEGKNLTFLKWVSLCIRLSCVFHCAVFAGFLRSVSQAVSTSKWVASLSASEFDDDDDCDDGAWW